MRVRRNPNSAGADRRVEAGPRAAADRRQVMMRRGSRDAAGNVVAPAAANRWAALPLPPTTTRIPQSKAAAHSQSQPNGLDHLWSGPFVHLAFKSRPDNGLAPVLKHERE